MLTDGAGGGGIGHGLERVVQLHALEGEVLAQPRRVRGDRVLNLQTTSVAMVIKYNVEM